jgi:hypothetical protein
VNELLTLTNAGWTTLGLLVLVFGFVPGPALSLITRLLAADDPRRDELHAELYAVPRWERPFWVAQQFEVALREGVAPRASWRWGRHVWHRAKIDSGLARHREHPDTFWVPSDEDKAELRPGDGVKLMWSIKRMPGERMWLTITHRDGDNLVGVLDNWAVFAHIPPGEVVKFRIDDIIDFNWEEDRGEVRAGPPGVSAYHAECNGAGSVSG